MTAWMDWRRLALVGFGLAAAALGVALISQFFFGLAPCPMCVTQRWPYVAGLAAAALAFGLTRVTPLALAAAAIAFAVGVGLGVWHSGVEFGWFPAPDCAGDLLRDGDASTLGFGPRCDAREPFFLGLSMANWNVLVSLAVAAVFIAALLARLGVVGPAGRYSSSSASQ